MTKTEKTKRNKVRRLAITAPIVEAANIALDGEGLEISFACGKLHIVGTDFSGPDKLGFKQDLSMRITELTGKVFSSHQIRCQHI